MNSLEVAKQVIETEIQALRQMFEKLDSTFANVVDFIVQSRSRVIICGMGKSGLIGKKIAASFSSTGTSSFFIHPSEAFHGDLGMIMPGDIFIAISNSGETEEVIKLLPFLRDNQNSVIAITGNPKSTLSLSSNYHLDIGVSAEACPFQLAPTSSTTATLVMGDALTIALMEKRGFQPENFARFHPGGSLGKRLLSKVKDEMIKDMLPTVELASPIPEVINVITSGSLGLALVIDKKELVGIITDGDLRRAIESFGRDLFDLHAEDICSESPISVNEELPVSVAYELMHAKSVSSLVVKNNNCVVGVLKK